jgi:integrase
MARKTASASGRAEKTTSGHTRDIKVERIGPVTIYRRGKSYSLYFRERGVTRRNKIDGNLAVARATAAKVAAALADDRPAPIGHERTGPRQMVEGYIEYIAQVQNLAIRTRERYRAALDRLLDFCEDAQITTLDAVDDRAVEDFVRWLRGQRRTRNGSANGKREVYKTGGIRFILSTARTAFNWAARRRMLPPYAANPFKSFPIDKLRDRDEPDARSHVFTPEQEKAFFAACGEWQRGIFLMLASYGLRVGELTHLLVEDVDFEVGTVEIRSKPELFWSVKTGRSRTLPLVPQTRDLLTRAIAGRVAGFVFSNEWFANGRTKPSRLFASDRAFRAHAQKLAADIVVARPGTSEKERRREVTTFCRGIGQIPERRVRGEFMKLTRRIGCPEFTRAHDLRHLFSTRAQEAGMNPLMVQDLLGHSTLDMTRRYTHLGMDAKRDAMLRLRPGEPD